MARVGGTIASRIPAPASGGVSRADAGPTLAGAAILVLLAVVLAAAVYRYPPPSAALVLVGGLGLCGVLALAIARYDAAVALGLALLGVVAFEPAPPDAVFGIVIAVAAVTGRFDLQRVPLVVLVTLGAFLALNMLSTIEAVDGARAATFFAITLYLGVFALWFVGYVTSERRARIVVGAYLVAAIFSAVLGLVTLVAIPGNELLVLGGSRAKALFKDANVFGPFLIPIAIILFEDTLRPRLLKIAVPWKLMMFTLLLVGVLFSFSRAAWLNLGVSVIVLAAVLLLRRGDQRRLVAALGIVIVAVAATAAVVSFTGSAEFLDSRAELQSYDAERFNAQRAGLELAQTHPIGTGPGQYELVIQKAAHNTLIRVFAEQGPLGLASIVVISLATLLMAIRNATAGRSTYGIGSAALLAAWVGVLANGAFVDTLHWRHMWIVAALIWVGAMRRASDSSEPALPGLASSARDSA